MIHKPPNWKKIIQAKNLEKFFQSKELTAFIKKADQEYIYWDTFRYYPMPIGITPEEAWGYLKLSRLASQEITPVKSTSGGMFHYSLNKTMFQKLSHVDSYTSGFLGSSTNPTTSIQKEQLILSGLTEEAIASSQIEGANTSRKVAKEMLLTKRKPRTQGEQMIINNFQVMQRLQEWKSLDLTEEMILEIQRMITKDTLDDEQDSGRFRDSNDIHVVDSLTGESVHIPPDSKIIPEELSKLIQYANTNEGGDEFVHPVIKACILHFWLSYLHPFVDGNGRTARTLFYWFLLRNNYWLFQYLSVSRIIKKSKRSYDNSFIYSELDDNDMTYFLTYNLRVIKNAIIDFIEYYKRKTAEEEKLKVISAHLAGLNPRQIGLMVYLLNHPDKTVSINQHQVRNQVVYETARKDLMILENKGYLTPITKGKKFVYLANLQTINSALSSVKAEIQINLS